MNESFLNRWSRLKRASTSEPAHCSEAQSPDPALPSPDPAPVPAPAPEIDLSSLPAIESIDAESNVAVFLQAGVPDDLTRAALRNAWLADPAIRDFVGVAENQWDFNGEGIPGFGSLSAEEYARYLAARALQAETAAVSQDGNRESGAPVGGGDAIDGPPVPSAPIAPPENHPVAQSTVDESQDGLSAPASGSEPDCAPRKKQTHGSALPK